MTESNVISEKDLKKVIAKYSRFYAYSRNLDISDATSEVGFATVKAMRSWGDMPDKACQFKTFLDRVIKNHMRDYFRAELTYSKRIMLVSEPNGGMDNSCSEMTGFDVLTAFSGKEYHMASEFISPSEKVLKIIKAIRAKFSQDFKGDYGKEADLLKAGVDCFAVSLVYDISIWYVAGIKRKIYEKLKNSD